MNAPFDTNVDFARLIAHMRAEREKLRPLLDAAYERVSATHDAYEAAKAEFDHYDSLMSRYYQAAEALEPTVEPSKADAEHPEFERVFTEDERKAWLANVKVTCQ